MRVPPSRSSPAQEMAWRWAYSAGHVPTAPLAMPEVRIVAVRDRYTPSAGEVARVLAQLDGWPRMALLLVWSTGARIGEIGHLRPEDVDLDSGILHLDGKTGPRDVPLSPSLARELAEWMAEPRPSPWLLGVEPCTSEVVGGHHWEAAMERAGVRRWTAHALRRLAVDQLARSGVDVATAADLLGHSPEVMLAHYRQVSPDDRRRALAAARLGEAPAEQVIDLGSRRR